MTPRYIMCRHTTLTCYCVVPRTCKKTPEYKRILDRSRRLWETYDAKPLKKNLVAFGTHVERMEKSSSLKVKAEARRAARAFNAEFRARGWKKKGKKGA